MMEAAIRVMNTFEDKGMSSKPKKRQVPLEAGKGKGTDSPLETPEGMLYCLHLDFRTSYLPNCKTIDLCCFKRSMVNSL